MRKHSNSPWVSTTTTNPSERGVRNSAGFICILPKPTRYNGQDERYKNELEEYEANAKLIAAAPDMLSALEEIRIYFGENDKTVAEHKMFAVAHLAIKKATE